MDIFLKELSLILVLETMTHNLNYHKLNIQCDPKLLIFVNFLCKNDLIMIDNPLFLDGKTT